MDFQRIDHIIPLLERSGIATGREAQSLARWIWEDILEKKPGSEGELNTNEIDKVNNALARLKQGEPVQYIAGHAWFYGKKFFVTPGVLIPRPETEELVEWIYATCKNKIGPLRILDIGTGSGCIAIMLNLLLGSNADVVGIDISSEALHVATRNSDSLGASVTFRQHDFLALGFLGLGEFDVIVSNPPYISRELAGSAIVEGLRYEPELALYPLGDDPDIFYRKIIQEGWASLNENGYVFLEINEFRKELINDLLCQSEAWTGNAFRRDMQGNWRMLRLRG